MPDNGDQASEDPRRTILKLFDLGELVAAPITALLDADYQAARRLIELIQHFGFEAADPDEEDVGPAGFPRKLGKIQTVSFRINRPRGGRSVPYTVTVPLLSLIPLPLLQIKEAEFNFNVRLIGGVVEEEGRLPEEPVYQAPLPPEEGAPQPREEIAPPPRPRPSAPVGPPRGIVRMRRRPAAPRSTLLRNAGAPPSGPPDTAAGPTQPPTEAPPAEEQVQRVVFNATLGRADGAAATYRASRMQAEGNMRVRIAMAQGDMPEGVAQLLNLMSQSLTREEETPPPEEGQADVDSGTTPTDEREGGAPGDDTDSDRSGEADHPHKEDDA